MVGENLAGENIINISSTIGFSVGDEILIISTPEEINRYKNLLGNGSELGLRLSFEIQYEPNGLAEDFIIAEFDVIVFDNQEIEILSTSSLVDYMEQKIVFV